MQGTTNRTKDVLIEAGFHNITANDIAIAQHVSAVISHRAALLVAITTSVLLKRLIDPDVTIAIDGSVYKNHPRMHEWLTRIIGKLNTTNKIVSFYSQMLFFFLSIFQFQFFFVCSSV